MANIAPIQQQFPLVTKDGFITVAFKRWTDQILQRCGGITGGTYSPLTVAAGTFLWDLNNAPVAVITLGNGVNTLSPPVGMVAGLMYRLTIIQPAAGAAGTISWASAMKFPGGTPPTLSTANGAIDEVIFDSDGTNMKLVVFGKNYS